MTLELEWPWRVLCDASEATALTGRLDLEVGPEHALWGQGAKVVARSDADDDVMARLEDGRFAIVHLTWNNNPGGAVWPHALFFASADDAARAAFENTRSNRE